MAELARWSPPRIARLITEQRDYAATVLTVDAVANFWRLQDFARCKARAFAGVTQRPQRLSGLDRVPQTIDHPPDFEETLRGQGAAFVVETSSAPAAFPAAISGQSSAN